ncbi:S-layer homology domain-containing protein [Fusibacter ferrireducens]|uniref:S-layer homology domain-containing protein n=1 Tax=Fusibacter ferrireducens TaxID=2785058 RepID=A0ABS0A0V6_9FIRM|nr:S-layer homology domain-containing protein [Fusibacter ferrireducens]MBF4695509.1 S-layer homology domain-containing protein [Fusibacter ferrireducens]
MKKNLILILILGLLTAGFSFAEDTDPDVYILNNGGGYISPESSIEKIDINGVQVYNYENWLKQPVPADVSLGNLGIISGDGNGYASDRTISREEMVTMLLKIDPRAKEDYILPSTPSFVDVPKTSWAYKYVEQAKSLGITSGVSEGVFGIGEAVNYKQATSFLLNMLGYKIDWNTVEQQASDLGIVSKSGLENTSGLLKRYEVFELIVGVLNADTNDGQYFGDLYRAKVGNVELELPVRIWASLKEKESYLALLMAMFSDKPTNTYIEPKWITPLDSGFYEYVEYSEGGAKEISLQQLKELIHVDSVIFSIEAADRSAQEPGVIIMGQSDEAYLDKLILGSDAITIASGKSGSNDDDVLSHIKIVAAGPMVKIEAEASDKSSVKAILDLEGDSIVDGFLHYHNVYGRANK